MTKMTARGYNPSFTVEVAPDPGGPRKHTVVAMREHGWVAININDGRGGREVIEVSMGRYEGGELIVTTSRRTPDGRREPIDRFRLPPEETA